MYILVCFSLGLIHMRLSALPRLGWLFSFLCSGSFWLQCFQIFSQTLSLYSPSGTPKIWMFMHLILLQRPLRCPPPFFLILFSLFCSAPVISTLISSSSLTFLLFHTLCYRLFSWVIFLLLLQVIFQVDCLWSLYLFGFVRFNFATVCNILSSHFF